MDRIIFNAKVNAVLSLCKKTELNKLCIEEAIKNGTIRFVSYKQSKQGSLIFDTEIEMPVWLMKVLEMDLKHE
jgi:hypothetical protein